MRWFASYKGETETDIKDDLTSPKDAEFLKRRKNLGQGKASKKYTFLGGDKNYDVYLNCYLLKTLKAIKRVLSTHNKLFIINMQENEYNHVNRNKWKVYDLVLFSDHGFT